MLNDNAEPPRYLVRTLQRYIDNTLTLAVNLSPSRDSSIYENPIYDLGMMDLAGLLGRCADLDVRW